MRYILVVTVLVLCCGIVFGGVDDLKVISHTRLPIGKGKHKMWRLVLEVENTGSDLTETVSVKVIYRIGKKIVGLERIIFSGIKAKETKVVTALMFAVEPKHDSLSYQFD